MSIQSLIVFAFTISILISASGSENTKQSNKISKIIANDKKIKDLTENIQKNLKNIATMGIMMGTAKTARKMETNILLLVHEFIKILQRGNMKQAANKFQKIEDTIERDKKSIEILSNAMNLAMKKKTLREYRQALHKISSAEKVSSEKKQLIIPKDKRNLMKQLQTDVGEHLKFLRKKIDSTMHETISNVNQQKKKLEKVSSTSSTVTLPFNSNTHANDIFKYETYDLPQLYIRMPILPIHQRNVESFYRFRRQNDDDIMDNNIENGQESSSGDDEEFGDGLDAPDGGGGIVGLIGNLSGGEGGSDVGALIGALSGVITSLFGPGGLDIPTLLSTGTSLLAGLLSGDENFGKVLASYIGIAVEGFSGGGGADNNGEFFGNFVGTLFAQLSADPEEDDVPPKPKIFFENFLKGFDQSKQKRGAENPQMPKNYIFEFISNIISSVVGGITNLILNSSLGSSGGSSRGSADLSAGSSQGSQAGSAYASQSSAAGSMKPSQMISKPK